ncbi:MAG: Rieske 2Fe-2S domain-containing protein [Gemmatimonadaceae bacterium]
MTAQLPAVVPEIAVSNGQLTRREFLAATGVTMASCWFLQACSGDGPTSATITSAPTAGSVTFANGIVVLDIMRIPDLAADSGHTNISISDGDKHAELVVINVGDGVYRAFTSVCTHEGCTVSGYANKRMQCPCHGSEFDLTGQPVAGPAPTALRQYRATFNAATQTLSVAVS